MKHIWIAEAMWRPNQKWEPLEGLAWEETRREAIRTATRRFIEDSNDAWPKIRAIEYVRKTK